jgi:hypothetical protein
MVIHKKGHMKSLYNLLLPLFLLCLAGIACKKESFMNQAVITGIDATLCGCCGGLFVNFDGETNSPPSQHTFYLAQNDPKDLGIDNTTSFPVYMDVDWEALFTVCASMPHQHIRITKFRKR